MIQISLSCPFSLITDHNFCFIWNFKMKQIFCFIKSKYYILFFSSRFCSDLHTVNVCQPHIFHLVIYIQILFCSVFSLIFIDRKSISCHISIILITLDHVFLNRRKAFRNRNIRNRCLITNLSYVSYFSTFRRSCNRLQGLLTIYFKIISQFTVWVIIFVLVFRYLTDHKLCSVICFCISQLSATVCLEFQVIIKYYCRLQVIIRIIYQLIFIKNIINSNCVTVYAGDDYLISDHA